MRDILVWHVNLSGSDKARRRCWDLLAPDERARADRFHAASDRTRYILSRGALRSILGEYVGAAPPGLEFRRSPFGKPSLAGPGMVPEFSVSRALDLMVCAIAERTRIGIDVETISQPIAGRAEATYFSSLEREQLDRLTPFERDQAVAICWTRKEAFIKARGKGLSFSFDAFDVSVHPDPPRLLATRPDRDEASRWSLYDLEIGAPRFVGTIAVEGPGWRIRRFAWRADPD